MVNQQHTFSSPYLQLQATPDEGTVVAAMPSGRENVLVIGADNTVSGAFIKATWTGTKAQYDAIAVKDANTQYVTDAGIYVGDSLVGVGATIDPVTGGIGILANGDLVAAGNKYIVQPSGDTTGVVDAVAINAAVSAAGTAGSGCVVLAEGSYVVSSPIVLAGMSNVVVAARYKSASIKLADNQSAAAPGDMKNIIEITGSTACAVIGVALDGNYQNQNMANLAMSFSDLAQGGSGNRRDPLTIRYVGAGSAASMTISGGVLTTTCTGASEDNLSLDLSSAPYDTLAELVAYIDGLSTYEATIVHASFGSQRTSRLYGRTYADIKSATVGIDFTNASNAATHEIYGNNIIIKDSNECVIYDCDLSNAAHMGVLVTGNSSRNTIRNNSGQYNNWRACEIWPNAGTNSSHNLVIGNQFKNSYHDSIIAEFPGTFRNSILGNTVLLDDLSFNDGKHEGIMVYDSAGNIVSGNTCNGCFIVVQVGACDYNIITANTVDGQDRHGSLSYLTRGVYIKNGKGNVVVGNTLHDPYYDTIRIASGASKTVVKDNVLSLNDNGSRYPIIIEASSADNVLGDNILDGNTNGISDLGTRTIHNGLGQNGSNDPASAGNWSGNGKEGLVVAWDNGAGKKRLSRYSNGAWINFYSEP